MFTRRIVEVGEKKEIRGLLGRRHAPGRRSGDNYIYKFWGESPEHP